MMIQNQKGSSSSALDSPRRVTMMISAPSEVRNVLNFESYISQTSSKPKDTPSQED
jgi:hypothetical protein